MQRLEDFGVAAIEVRGVDARDSRVTLTDGLQRLSRGVSMVEERVVEIEEDRSNQRAALGRADAPEARSDAHAKLS